MTSVSVVSNAPNVALEIIYNPENEASKNAAVARAAMIDDLFMKLLDISWPDMAISLALLRTHEISNASASLDTTRKNAHNAIVKEFSHLGDEYIPVGFFYDKSADKLSMHFIGGHADQHKGFNKMLDIAVQLLHRIALNKNLLACVYLKAYERAYDMVFNVPRTDSYLAEQGHMLIDDNHLMLDNFLFLNDTLHRVQLPSTPWQMMEPPTAPTAEPPLGIASHELCEAVKNNGLLMDKEPQ